jgi:hypothetical protein
MILKPRHPFPRIRHFREAGIGVMTGAEEYKHHCFRNTLGGPNLAKTKHPLVNLYYLARFLFINHCPECIDKAAAIKGIVSRLTFIVSSVGQPIFPSAN